MSMKLLKRIPLTYHGELHHVRLINFSVEMHEVKDNIPAPLQARNFDGRALISMVDVQLKKMRPSFVPPFMSFSYRHIAFRLLVDDAAYNSGSHKGIFFLRSFNDKPHIIFAGNILTDYNLGLAHIEERNNRVEVMQNNHRVTYSLGTGTGSLPGKIENLKQTIGELDRAYSLLDGGVRVTQIQREQWPIQPVSCDGFENTFFETARLEGAFQVQETIYYKWLPPKAILL